MKRKIYFYEEIQTWLYHHYINALDRQDWKSAKVWSELYNRLFSVIYGRQS